MPIQNVEFASGYRSVTLSLAQLKRHEQVHVRSKVIGLYSTVSVGYQLQWWNARHRHADEVADKCCRCYKNTKQASSEITHCFPF